MESSALRLVRMDGVDRIWKVPTVRAHATVWEPAPRLDDRGVSIAYIERVRDQKQRVIMTGMHLRLAKGKEKDYWALIATYTVTPSSVRRVVVFSLGGRLLSRRVWKIVVSEEDLVVLLRTSSMRPLIILQYNQFRILDEDKVGKRKTFFIFFWSAIMPILSVINSGNALIITAMMGKCFTVMTAVAAPTTLW